MDKVKKAIRQTAYEYGMPVSQVEDDIQSIIDECYNNSDQEVRKMWEQICPGGAAPTAAQLIVTANQSKPHKNYGTKFVPFFLL